MLAILSSFLSTITFMWIVDASSTATNQSIYRHNKTKRNITRNKSNTMELDAFQCTLTICGVVFSSHLIQYRFLFCKVYVMFVVPTITSSGNGTQTAKRLVGEFAQFIIVSAFATVLLLYHCYCYWVCVRLRNLQFLSICLGDCCATVLLFLLSMLLNMVGSMQDVVINNSAKKPAKISLAPNER